MFIVAAQREGHDVLVMASPQIHPTPEAAEAEKVWQQEYFPTTDWQVFNLSPAS